MNEENYDKNIEQLKNLGITVRTLPEDVRASWADSLRDWPQLKATELDEQGLPGSEVLKLTLDAAEKAGYSWPNRYKIQ